MMQGAQSMNIAELFSSWSICCWNIRTKEGFGHLHNVVIVRVQGDVARCSVERSNVVDIHHLLKQRSIIQTNTKGWSDEFKRICFTFLCNICI